MDFQNAADAQKAVQALQTNGVLAEFATGLWFIVITMP